MKYRVTITDVETGNVCLDEENSAVFLCTTDEKRVRRALLVENASLNGWISILYHAQNMISAEMVEHPDLEGIFERIAEREAKKAAEAEMEKEAEQE